MGSHSPATEYQSLGGSTAGGVAVAEWRGEQVVATVQIACVVGVGRTLSGSCVHAAEMPAPRTQEWQGWRRVWFLRT